MIRFANFLYHKKLDFGCVELQAFFDYITTKLLLAKREHFGYKYKAEIFVDRVVF